MKSSPSIESFELSRSGNPQTNILNEELSVSASILSRDEIKTIQLSAQLADSNQDLLNESLPSEKCTSKKKEMLECSFTVLIPKNRIEPGTYTFELTVLDKEGDKDDSKQEYLFEVSE